MHHVVSSPIDPFADEPLPDENADRPLFMEADSGDENFDDIRIESPEERDDERREGAREERNAPQVEKLVWGTNVNINETALRYRDFFDGFMNASTNRPRYHEYLEEVISHFSRAFSISRSSPSDTPYDQSLSTSTFLRMMTLQMHQNNSSVLNLCAADVAKYDMTLYKQLVAYPQEIIPLIDIVAHEVYKELFPGTSCSSFPHNSAALPFAASCCVLRAYTRAHATNTQLRIVRHAIQRRVATQFR